MLEVNRMSNIYNIVPINNDSQCLLFYPNQSKMIDETMHTSTIHFGLQEMEVTCKSLNTLKENEIGLSNTVIENLQLPLGVDYEISIQNGRIIIGPFIGILVADSQEVLNKSKKRLKHVIKQYPLIRGVIVAFSWEGIDRNNSKVNGYIYNPSSKKWESGNFPFPTVIVKRTLLSRERKKYLKNLYGSRFFHLATLNKWKMYQRLSSNKQLLPHLPKTFLYKKPEDIIKHLKTFCTIYVKPLSGLQGIGIEKFVAESNQYCVKYRRNKKNKTIIFSSEHELLDYVKSKFKSKKYIIQQGIDLELEKNHTIDFRIALIKNQSGLWEDVGMIGRKGIKGSIVSNLSNGGKVEFAKSLLLTSLHLTEAEMVSIRQIMTDIAIKAAGEIDKHENIFKSGVDIAIDRHRHIWIIELNNFSPGFRSFSKVGFSDAVSKIKNSRMFYAKYLAGFPEDNGNGTSK
ncbi:YheC/YheD family protein [Viridibacillus sp. NPDC093762]|uniref:YheC/YheD family endospore coat-associated protein n=1 Tax=Viridibacillus sp. NPDC093762 TaxID=3390720 RepID=UPI003CFBE18B